MSNKSIILSAIIFWVSVIEPAYAYVDPGSGSVIITTILGLFAAIGYTFRKYFYKMKRLFTGRREEEGRGKLDD